MAEQQQNPDNEKAIHKMKDKAVKPPASDKADRPTSAKENPK